MSKSQLRRTKEKKELRIRTVSTTHWVLPVHWAYTLLHTNAPAHPTLSDLVSILLIIPVVLSADATVPLNSRFAWKLPPEVSTWT